MREPGMAEATKVFAISGSLRKGSFNRLVLKAAIELAPPGMSIDHYENLGDIPPYKDDVREKGYPPVVEDLRKRVKAADAILFVTPEYNYSVPGVLKNAIDWASRPPEPPLDSKPCASNLFCAWAIITSGRLIGNMLRKTHICRKWYWARAEPSKLMLAPIMAQGLLSSGGSGGREAQSIAFLSTPGTE